MDRTPKSTKSGNINTRNKHRYIKCGTLGHGFNAQKWYNSVEIGDICRKLTWLTYFKNGTIPSSPVYDTYMTAIIDYLYVRPINNLACLHMMCGLLPSPRSPWLREYDLRCDAPKSIKTGFDFKNRICWSTKLCMDALGCSVRCIKALDRYWCFFV